MKQLNYLIFLFFPLMCGGLSLEQGDYYRRLSFQPIKNDCILWKPDIKLHWVDFQGKIDSISKYKAITSTMIEVKPESKTDSTSVYEVICLFEKNKSWTKNRKSIKLLKHEQLHFDIAELATRKLRKKIVDYNFMLNPDSVKIVILRIFDEAIIERRLINQKYDLETNHSADTIKQKEWEEKIAKELKTLSAYSSTKVVIKRIPKNTAQPK